MRMKTSFMLAAFAIVVLLAAGISYWVLGEYSQPVPSKSPTQATAPPAANPQGAHNSNPAAPTLAPPQSATESRQGAEPPAPTSTAPSSPVPPGQPSQGTSPAPPPSAALAATMPAEERCPPQTEGRSRKHCIV